MANIQNLQHEKGLANFISQAVPRGAGVKHKVTGVERDAQGNIIAFSGTVTPAGSDALPALWNLQGNEAKTGHQDYCLVTKENFNDWLKALDESSKETATSKA